MEPARDRNPFGAADMARTLAWFFMAGGVVADETVRQECVIGAVDAKRIDRLHTVRLDRFNRRVVVVAGHERSDDGSYLFGCNPLEDRGTPVLMATQ